MPRRLPIPFPNHTSYPAFRAASRSHTEPFDKAQDKLAEASPPASGCGLHVIFMDMAQNQRCCFCEMDNKERLTSKFRPLASHGTPLRHSKTLHRCDTRKHGHSGNRQRWHHRVF
jgi:hypothetical protein